MSDTITAQPKQTLTIPTNDPKAIQELRVVLPALLVALGIQELTTDFATRRDSLTGAVYEFTQPPENEAEQDEILAAQRAVAKLRTELTKQADAHKAVLNDPRQKIIDMVNAATVTLKKSEEHAAGLIQHRQRKLIEEQRKAQDVKDAEARRIADLQAESQRAEQAAQRYRDAAALAAQQAHKAKTDAERQKAAQEAATLTQQAQAQEAVAMEASLAAEAAPAPQEAVEAPQAKTVRVFEVIGRSESEQKASLIKLLCAQPMFFKATIRDETPREYSLKLVISDFTDAINSRDPFKPIDSAPGVNITETIKTLR